jgi:hypothetical protein
MKKVTIDTNVFPINDIVNICKRHGFEYTVVSVTNRELENTDFEEELKSVPKLKEVGVWGESKWGECVWGGDEISDKLDKTIDIISNKSMPKKRDNLTDGQKRILRDAMIFEAHIRNDGNIFITNDKKAFINDGRRKKLEKEFGTIILTKEEFIEKYKP